MARPKILPQIPIGNQPELCGLSLRSAQRRGRDHHPPAPLETVALRKLLAAEGKMLSTLIKDRKLAVD